MQLDKTPRMLEVEAEHGGKPLPDILRESYNRTENLIESAQELGISYGTIRRWMIEFGIPMRRIAYTSQVREYSPDKDTQLALARIRRKQEQRQTKEKVKAIGVHVYPSQHDWLRNECHRLSIELGMNYTMGAWIRDRIEEHMKGQ